MLKYCTRTTVSVTQTSKRLCKPTHTTKGKIVQQASRVMAGAQRTASLGRPRWHNFECSKKSVGVCACVQTQKADDTPADNEICRLSRFLATTRATSATRAKAFTVVTIDFALQVARERKEQAGERQRENCEAIRPLLAHRIDLKNVFENRLDGCAPVPSE